MPACWLSRSGVGAIDRAQVREPHPNPSPEGEGLYWAVHR
ncbi:protein of unknown function [uncultured Sphingopyxis sp.]|uniref:Uncharacterized protein n=1 Tax=uncultured Sphingopyxis sp. TaxID=310581 RepID=A0A1Y5PMZ0_9SPHN|nr:protein of unknown function [uncultured Sphingopyxis sp.]